MKRKNFGWLVAGVIPIALLVGTIHGGTADVSPEPPKPKAEAAIEKPLTPEQKAGQILILLDIEQPTLPEVLDYFAILGAQQGVKLQDPPDIKAQFFLASARSFIFENGKKVEIAKAEAKYTQAFKVRKTPPKEE